MDAASLDLLAKSGGWAAVLLVLLASIKVTSLLGDLGKNLAVLDTKLDGHFKVCEPENHRKK